MTKQSSKKEADRLLGCLLAGAIGDALGAAVEFMPWGRIQQEFGNQGVTRYAQAYGRLGAITDDTQMMLFTAEGLIRAVIRNKAGQPCHPPAIIHHALLRWLITQGINPDCDIDKDGWLITHDALWARRAPGTTCLRALSMSSYLGELAFNDRKGCGGIMRVAPCAFFSDAFETAGESAHYTHGHLTGHLAAGLYAAILQRLWQSQLPLEQACIDALESYGGRPGMEETRRLVEYILRLHRQAIKPTPELIEDIGGGWVADEAMAIGLWCALAANSLEDGICLAVNHSGDSDSTGMIAGNLLGMVHGASQIPEHWLQDIE